MTMTGEHRTWCGRRVWVAKKSDFVFKKWFQNGHDLHPQRNASHFKIFRLLLSSNKMKDYAVTTVTHINVNDTSHFKHDIHETMLICSPDTFLTTVVF